MMTASSNQTDITSDSFLIDDEQIEIDHEEEDPDRLDYDEYSDDDDDNDDDNVAESQDHLSHINNLQKSLRESRNNSWTSFMTRSERNAVLGKDKPPSLEETKKRRIKFQDDLVSSIHEIPDVTDDEKKHYWLTRHDLERVDTEMKMTLFRWQNHLDGKIKFNEDDNTTRGLEAMIARKQHQLVHNQNKHHKRAISKDSSSNDDTTTTDRPILNAIGTTMGIVNQPPPKLYNTGKTKHVKNVLSEMNRQKIELGKNIYTMDWEHIRKVSLESSDESFIKAYEMGKKDEYDRKVALGEILPTIISESEESSSHPKHHHNKHHVFGHHHKQHQHHKNGKINTTNGVTDQLKNTLFFWQNKSSPKKK